MSYADSLLARDEQVLYRARQFWLAPVSDSVRPAVLLLIGLLLVVLEHWILHWSQYITYVGLIVALVGLGWIGIIVATWRSQEYCITNRRVLKVEGLLDKKTGDSALDKINDAILTQGLLARILRYGDLEILTANEDAIDRYEMLAHVVDFKKAMLDAKNHLEDAARFRPSTSPAPAPAYPGVPVSAPVPPAPTAAQAAQMSSEDVTRTLAQLADLRDKGAITPAEYESKKAELLGRL